MLGMTIFSLNVFLKETNDNQFKWTDSIVIMWSSTSGELTISEGIEHQFTVEEMDAETYTGLLIYKWVNTGEISSSIRTYISTGDIRPTLHYKFVYNVQR